ncbi:MAG: DegT/DnrJ/EryC1/StrS family aminotransferase [Acidimicrobiia bacterium]|nr:DegT/DnrJ/EryC1/StrS family aminotransferase [Acidimicrobiia bacterium]
MQPELGEAVSRVLASGQLLLGPELDAFESHFAGWCGRGAAVGVASGTDALRLTLTALGIGAGDEVIVPAFTAVPTAAAVLAAGAVPVMVDVDAETAAIDPAEAEAAVTERTRAVVPVHMYGRPAPVDELAGLGVAVIEDAAQAHGAAAPSGSASVAACYSFYPTKNLGGIGDGGAVVTDDADLVARVRLLRHHGMRDQYVHEVVATNSRMSEVEAAALSVALRHLDAGNERRREIAHRYRAAAPGVAWQRDHPRHVYHLCVLRTADRDAWRARRPFATAVHYPLAVTQQPGYAHLARRPCPRAEAWAAECVSVPCFPEMTDEEVETVCEALT